MTHIITEEEYRQCVEIERKTQDKKISKKLRVIILRYEGKSIKEIGEYVKLTSNRVSHIIADFKNQGIDKFSEKKYGGNHRSLEKEEEKEILSGLAENAAEGQLITVQDIKDAFSEKRGKTVSDSYIHYVLKRNDWRKVKPRPHHPKKASEAEIEASKKLRQNSKN